MRNIYDLVLTYKGYSQLLKDLAEQYGTRKTNHQRIRVAARHILDAASQGARHAYIIPRLREIDNRNEDSPPRKSTKRRIGISRD